MVCFPEDITHTSAGTQPAHNAISLPLNTIISATLSRVHSTCGQFLSQLSERMFPSSLKVKYYLLFQSWMFYTGSFPWRYSTSLFVFGGRLNFDQMTDFTTNAIFIHKQALAIVVFHRESLMLKCS